MDSSIPLPKESMRYIVRGVVDTLSFLQIARPGKLTLLKDYDRLHAETWDAIHSLVRCHDPKLKYAISDFGDVPRVMCETYAELCKACANLEQNRSMIYGLIGELGYFCMISRMLDRITLIHPIIAQKLAYEYGRFYDLLPANLQPVPKPRALNNVDIIRIGIEEFLSIVWAHIQSYALANGYSHDKTILETSYSEGVSYFAAVLLSIPQLFSNPS